MANSTRQSFIMRHEQMDVFDKLSDEETGKIIKALFEFSIHGVCPELEFPLNIFIIPMIQAIERDSAAYEERCCKNAEAAARRWEKERAKRDAETTARGKTSLTEENTVSEESPIPEE